MGGGRPPPHRETGSPRQDRVRKRGGSAPTAAGPFRKTPCSEPLGSSRLPITRASGCCVTVDALTGVAARRGKTATEA
jgi:hypothetical protein